MKFASQKILSCRFGKKPQDVEFYQIIKESPSLLTVQRVENNIPVDRQRTYRKKTDGAGRMYVQIARGERAYIIPPRDESLMDMPCEGAEGLTYRQISEQMEQLFAQEVGTS